MRLVGGPAVRVAAVAALPVPLFPLICWFSRLYLSSSPAAQLQMLPVLLGLISLWVYLDTVVTLLLVASAAAGGAAPAARLLGLSAPAAAGAATALALLAAALRASLDPVYSFSAARLVSALSMGLTAAWGVGTLLGAGTPAARLAAGFAVVVASNLAAGLASLVAPEVVLAGCSLPGAWSPAGRALEDAATLDTNWLAARAAKLAAGYTLARLLASRPAASA